MSGAVSRKAALPLTKPDPAKGHRASGNLGLAPVAAVRRREKRATALSMRVTPKLRAVCRRRHQGPHAAPDTRYRFPKALWPLVGWGTGRGKAPLRGAVP